MATNTAASFTNHTGNGTAGPFTISFSYLAESEVNVFVGGVLKTITTHYTFSSATGITFTSGNEPGNGVAIKFQRDTDISAKKVDFEDGSVLTESDLDTQNDQILFGLQEFTDVVNNDAFLRDGSKTLTGSVVFEGSADDANETTLSVTNPTADRTITLPDTTGTVVTTGDTGTVTSTMINDGTIVNADINASASIQGTKISPDFGSQTITTSGVIFAGSKFSTDGNIEVDGTVDGRDVATDGTKLDGIETGATADQTASEIRTLVESASDSNVFTDADHTKLNGIPSDAINASNAAITNKLPLAGGTLTGNLTINNSAPNILFSDTNDGPSYRIEVDSSSLFFKGELTTASGTSVETKLSIVPQRVTVHRDLQVEEDFSVTGSTSFSNNVSLDGNKSTSYNPTATGGGLVINHTGSVAQFKNLTGQTRVSCADGEIIRLNNTDGSKIFATFGGATSASSNDEHVDLFFNNSRKATTVTDGLQVIGKLRAGFEGDLPTLSSTTRAVLHGGLDDTNSSQNSSSGISIFCKGNGNSRINFGNNLTEERSQIKYGNTNNRLDFLVRDITNSTVANQTLNTQLSINSTSVELNYSGSKKGETSATGFDITGNLTATGNIDLTDSSNILLGTDDDLEIFHNGTVGKIKNNTGNLNIQGDVVSLLNNAGNEFLLRATANGSISLYNDNALAAQTSSTGFNVVGSQIKLRNTANNADLVKIFHSGASTGNTLIAGQIGDIKIQPNEDGGQVRLFETTSSTTTQRLMTTNNGIDVNGDIRGSSGILFNNDTAAANTLDDYEEGTWTPTVLSEGTIGTPQYTCTYTKIGRLVTINADIHQLSDTTSSTFIRIGGLPYVPSTTSAIGLLANWSAVCHGERYKGGNSSIIVAFLLYSSGSWGINFRFGVPAGHYSNVKHSDISDDGTDNNLRFTLTYELTT